MPVRQLPSSVPSAGGPYCASGTFFWDVERSYMETYKNRAKWQAPKCAKTESHATVRAVARVEWRGNKGPPVSAPTRALLSESWGRSRWRNRIAGDNITVLAKRIGRILSGPWPPAMLPERAMGAAKSPGNVLSL